MIDTWEDATGFAALLDNPRLAAFVMGPGALPATGGEDDFRDAVGAAIATQKPVVLDGDVFRAFALQPSTLFSQLSPERHVLTPHAGEFNRLFGTPEGSKLEQAREAARKANAVIVYKGPDTVVAAPEGLAVIDTSGPATLATAGAGDVLAGLIAGFAAQAMPPFFAACAGVWMQAQSARLHGAALTAEDIISHIPQVFNNLFGLQPANS
jgi:NAD(P)H-hydrate epimerase